MRCEGHLRERWWAKGRRWDTLLYAILAPDWRAAGGAQPETPHDRRQAGAGQGLEARHEAQSLQCAAIRRAALPLVPVFR